MTRQLLATAAMAVCVAFAGANTASANGPHGQSHHHGGSGGYGGGYGGYGYSGGYGPRYYAPPVVIRPQPVYVAPAPYGAYAPAPCHTGYGYNSYGGYGSYGSYGGYGQSGIGFSNRDFSLWLGR